MEESHTDNPAQAEETVPKANASRIEQITTLRTGSGTTPLKRPVEVMRGEDGRLDQESRARIKDVVRDKQAHHERKEVSGMEAAMAQVDSERSNTLSQIAAMTESNRASSNAAIPAKVEQNRGASLA